MQRSAHRTGNVWALASCADRNPVAPAFSLVKLMNAAEGAWTLRKAPNSAPPSCNSLKQLKCKSALRVA